MSNPHCINCAIHSAEKGSQSLAGMKVRDAGFSATQLDPAPSDRDVHLFIAAPAGARAVVNGDTGEVYLDRDSEMVVTHVEQNSAGATSERSK